ncbi:MULTISPECIES: MBL fold metallo-hydrolase [unclassified Novosphingobium]|uniref:MBL fold metallo-hydrolase n=1 Tax=unclassified Novosphingobium TaxID=2644732 RepID=UPI0025E5B22F|nr:MULTISPECIES: MBL fold metallo-hydrolase [unclassified Novosphingobium]HQV02967.1 MBL fold metallo-hydrolase [Novosphingobium sp.]
MTRRLNWFLLGLILLLGLPYYWLLLDNRPGDAQLKPVTIAQLRQLAASIPGEAPYAVEVELSSFRRMPGNLFVAGSGLKRKLIGVMAWRLPIKGGKPVVIDSGLPKAAATDMGMEQFDAAAQARIEAALRDAGLILITHEHIDHEGGLIALNNPTALAAARLNPAQISGNRWSEMLPWPQGPRPRPAITGTAPVAVAPGVVVIPAHSHTPGSQMIFVRLASGQEFLFAGDISTFTQNWTETRARSRLVGDFLAPEERREVFAWLRSIQALKAQNPGLVVLPGHDYEWVIDPQNRTGVRQGFTSPSV